MAITTSDSIQCFIGCSKLTNWAIAGRIEGYNLIFGHTGYSNRLFLFNCV